jgi:hypothetical protein
LHSSQMTQTQIAKLWPSRTISSEIRNLLKFSFELLWIRPCVVLCSGSNFMGINNGCTKFVRLYDWIFSVLLEFYININFMVSKNYGFEIRLIRVWNRAWFFFKKKFKTTRQYPVKNLVAIRCFLVFLLKRRRFDFKKNWLSDPVKTRYTGLEPGRV